jgi:hypothetical protein
MNQIQLIPVTSRQITRDFVARRSDCSEMSRGLGVSVFDTRRHGTICG